MKDIMYIKISAGIFGLVGLIHLLRIGYGLPSYIGNWPVPMAFSYFAIVLTGLMLWWGIKIINKRK